MNRERRRRERRKFGILGVFWSKKRPKMHQKPLVRTFSKEFALSFFSEVGLDGTDRKNPPAYPVYASMGGMKFCKLYPSGIVRCASKSNS